MIWADLLTEAEVMARPQLVWLPLALRYRQDAETFKFYWRQTAASLRRIGDPYEKDGKRHDWRAEENDQS